MAIKNELKDPKGGSHKYVPNPTLNAEVWSQEYPPIITGAKFLRSIHTGQIFPNTEALAKRSDTMEPWFGDPADYPDGTAPSMTRPQTASSSVGLDDDEALEEL